MVREIGHERPVALFGIRKVSGAVVGIARLEERLRLFVRVFQPLDGLVERGGGFSEAFEFPQGEPLAKIGAGQSVRISGHIKVDLVGFIGLVEPPSLQQRPGLFKLELGSKGFVRYFGTALLKQLERSCGVAIAQ